uniref:Uncharacterized protein n=1 Tax=Pristionchus pacificus TaxID=54126 RepID=A0A2A6C8Z7_PRIPA|eukprot:PDM74523.1 hypothetical protein PRIPAC_41879 [Pristionchus pacificus]
MNAFSSGTFVATTHQPINHMIPRAPGFSIIQYKGKRILPTLYPWLAMSCAVRWHCCGCAFAAASFGRKANGNQISRFSGRLETAAKLSAYLLVPRFNNSARASPRFACSLRSFCLSSLYGK